MTKLSIIIPFYNNEKYIERCLRSVCEQDIPLEEYEIIAVSDASTDNSSAIVEMLQKEYSNIRLITLDKNHKQGGARNEGLKNAKGAWVWFVDADDYIKPNVLGKVLDNCLDDLDFIHFDYTEVRENGHSINTNYNLPTEIISGEEFLSLLGKNWGYTCVNVWQRIMRKSFLLYNRISFAEGVFIEDVDYSLRCFILAQKVRHIDIIPYTYCIYKSSSSRGIINGSTIYYWIELAKRCDIVNNTYKMSHESKELIRIYINYLIHQILANYSTLSKEDKNYVKKNIRFISLVRLFRYISFKKSLFLIYRCIFDKSISI